MEGRVEGVREVTHVRREEGGGEGRVVEKKETHQYYRFHLIIQRFVSLKISIYGQTKTHFL